MYTFNQTRERKALLLLWSIEKFSKEEENPFVRFLYSTNGMEDRFTRLNLELKLVLNIRIPLYLSPLVSHLALLDLLSEGNRDKKTWLTHKNPAGPVLFGSIAFHWGSSSFIEPPLSPPPSLPLFHSSRFLLAPSSRKTIRGLPKKRGEERAENKIAVMQFSRTVSGNLSLWFVVVVGRSKYFGISIAWYFISISSSSINYDAFIINVLSFLFFKIHETMRIP